MTYDQIFIFSLLFGVLAMLVWGKIRYDLVAFGALIIGVIGGAVPGEEAFSGFGHEATITVALVLIISRAMINSGAVELVGQYVVSAGRTLPVHIAIMSVAGAALSAIINNVAAIVILMGLDMEAARKAGRSVSLSLMPLSYATILGGMITLIGTPSNIVIAEYRRDVMGEPYSMFSFAPVGLVCAVVGITFVALIGYRLIPKRTDNTRAMAQESEQFLAEAKVPETSPAIGKTPSDYYELGDENDVTIIGVMRRGKRLAGLASQTELRKGDILLLEGEPKSIEVFIGAAKLAISSGDEDAGLTSPTVSLLEAIVPETSLAIGRSMAELKLRYRQGVELLGIARRGRKIRERVERTKLQKGDVLLLLGPGGALAEATESLGVLPLAGKNHKVIQRRKSALAIGIFVVCISLSVAGLLPLAVSLALAVALYSICNIVSATEVYSAIEWPVIVLLAAMLPLGEAFERAGGTELITAGIISLTDGWPAWSILAIVMIVTMLLSDFLNSIATALIAAPIGVGVANQLGVSPDTFLMGVAVAATCGFLTPIGHKNNMIIMGPGGYHFGDYWRIGLPLEILTIAVAIPAIMFFWDL